MTEKGHEAECLRCERILLVLNEFTLANGFAPSYREIADGAGFQAHSAIQPHLDVLEERGQIVRKARGKRAIAAVAR